MLRTSTTARVSRAALALGAALLLSSMAAHAVIPHEHPHFAFGAGIAAAQHGEERKVWFAMLLLGFLPIGAALAFVAVSYGRKDRDVPAFEGVGHALLAAFRRGILHPKLCG